MGLAASQSRFLLLTARKNNLATQMMSLTNQNMALQRQQSILSQNYEKQQSANYVTYNDNPLNYNEIMQPGGVTGANQMFTSSAGEVLLSDKFKSKLGKLPLGTSGSGKTFMEKYSEDEFLKAMLPGYDPVTNNGLGTSATTTKKSDTIYKDEPATSAFKYNDSIMNNAVVLVQADAVLDRGGYSTIKDESGSTVPNPDACMEYAMGTDQDNVNSLACIKTLICLFNFLIIFRNLHHAAN